MLENEAEEQTLLEVAKEYERRAKARECRANNFSAACTHIAGRTWRVSRSTLTLNTREHAAMCAAASAFKKTGKLINPARHLPRRPGVSVSALRMALSRLRTRLVGQLPILKHVYLNKEGFIICKPPSKKSKL
jgi:neutral trehalase